MDFTQRGARDAYAIGMSSPTAPVRPAAFVFRHSILQLVADMSGRMASLLLLLAVGFGLLRAEGQGDSPDAAARVKAVIERYDREMDAYAAAQSAAVTAEEWDAAQR